MLDIGAGSGTDSMIASRRVAEGGRVLAMDITPEMGSLLHKTQIEHGIETVEVLVGDAEHVPLPDASVDVVTSNGALNLVPDKRRAFAEIFRVLRPGGRVQIADIVISRPVPLGGRRDPELWAECVVGASIDEDYLDLFREAGFANIREIDSQDYFPLSPSADTRRIAKTLGARSATITMDRPAVMADAFGRSRVMRGLNPIRITRRITAMGLWGAMAGLVSMATCYGLVALLAVISMLGVGIRLDYGIWAAVVALTACIAVAATAVNWPRHRNPWPLIAAGIGGGLIVYVMAISYNMVVEAVGFLVLFGAIAADLYFIYQAECVPIHRRGRAGRADHSPSAHGSRAR